MKQITLFNDMRFFSADYQVVSWLFLRLLALIYFSAFASMAVQIEGLIGANGILPIAAKLAVLKQAMGNEKFIILPTIFWLDASDTTLKAVCMIGMGASVMVLFNMLTRIALLVCFLLYLSIMHAGQTFMTFQWDTFLLESGFLAIFLTSGSRIIIFLYRWLLARFMFMSGLVKLSSGDPTWTNLTALSYHFETQPLPTPVAWYAHHLPDWINQISVTGMFFIELVVPFFVFMSKRCRHFAAWSFIILQSSIILTGNYNFFNLLTILLCMFLFDDRDLEKTLPNKLIQRIQRNKFSVDKLTTLFSGILVVFIFLICGIYLWIDYTHQRPASPLAEIAHISSTFALVNYYGPFAIMTTQRKEIIIEGSNNGKNWHAYGFKYKPDGLKTELSWNIPHQPRLDWQMWFAALRPAQRDSWIDRFLQRLREGSPKVLGLLAHNPFPEEPPVYIRASLYRYTYTSPEARAVTGKVWRREFHDIYWPSSRRVQ